MIEKSYEKILLMLSGLWLFAIVWCAVLGLPQVPAWDQFVAWYSTFMPDRNGLTDFLEELRGVMYNLKTVDGASLQSITDFEGNGADTVFKIIAAFFNVFIVFVRIVGTVLVMGFLLGVHGLVYVLPQVLAYIAFLGGAFYTNYLPGVVAPIDWASQSGWLGYPDQSFVSLAWCVPFLAG